MTIFPCEDDFYRIFWEKTHPLLYWAQRSHSNFEGNLPATQWECLSTTTLNDLELFDNNFFSL